MQEHCELQHPFLGLILRIFKIPDSSLGWSRSIIAPHSLYTVSECRTWSFISPSSGWLWVLLYISKVHPTFTAQCCFSSAACSTRVAAQKFPVYVLNASPSSLFFSFWVSCWEEFFHGWRHTWYLQGWRKAGICKEGRKKANFYGCSDDEGTIRMN